MHIIFELHNNVMCHVEFEFFNQLNKSLVCTAYSLFQHSRSHLCDLLYGDDDTIVCGCYIGKLGCIYIF